MPDHSKEPSSFPSPLSSDSCCRSSLIATNQEGTKTRVIPIFCHKWSCPRCGKKKKGLWRSYALSGEPERLITLTCKPDELFTPRQQVKKMKQAFSRLIQKLRRKYGLLEYLAVWELTKAGMPHVHVLQRGTFIQKQELSDFWNDLTGAYIVDIKKIKSQDQVANYVMKYLTKAIAEMSTTFSGIRVIQRSKNWILEKHKYLFDRDHPEAAEPMEWRFVSASPAQIENYLSSVFNHFLTSDPEAETLTFEGDERSDIALAVAFAFDHRNS